MSSLPKTPIKGDPETRRFLEAVRQAIEGLDETKITVSDLKKQSFWDSLGDVGPGTTDPNVLVVQAPTVPVNLTASGVFQNIYLEWDFVAYQGHAFSRIYRSTTNNFSTASVIATANSTTFADQVSTGATFYYWVTNVNLLGVESAPNATAGTLGQTQQDIGYILSLLNGQITESQLFSSLNTRINLIDGSLPGSVNARIATETSARQAGDEANATSISQVSARLNNFGGGGVTVEQSFSATASSVTGLQGQYTVKIDNNGYVSGFGLASTSTTAAPFSSFVIRADRFSVASPSGPGITPIIPFTVTTTPTVENGVTIQPGVYINSAFIKDASITSAKIGSIQADKITTGSLKVTIGLDGDLNVGTGRIVFDTGTHMRVQGLGFGSANQFIEWFGPKLASFSLCTEANAISYIKANGDAYFGGSLSAGLLRNSAATTVTTVPAEIVVGPFSSNGDPKVVVLSYSYLYTGQISNALSYSGTPSATLYLERSLDGSNWTLLTSMSVTGTVTGEDGFGQFEPGNIRVVMSNSTTFTDTSGAGSTYHYRGRLVSRTLPTINSSFIGLPTETQNITVVSTEN